MAQQRGKNKPRYAYDVGDFGYHRWCRYFPLRTKLDASRRNYLAHYCPFSPAMGQRLLVNTRT
ncbi:hypothetical protein, partial [Salmonella enterica]|uniref:hypothetical protein n=1 Tax=Salmonella enterica TaxID=28901 RepID=UPI0021B2E21C